MSRSRFPSGSLWGLGLALAALALAGGCKDRAPNTPITLIQTPFAEGGHVPIVFTLRNPDTTRVDVDVSWAPSGGSFVTATAAPQSPPMHNLSASPGGTVHRFVWDALADLGAGQHAVRVRVIPRIDGHVGTSATTLTFTVDNTGVVELADLLALHRDGVGLAALASGGAVIAHGALGLESERVDAVSAEAQLAAVVSVARRDTVTLTLSDLDGGIEEARAVSLGGADASGSALDLVEVYDDADDQWLVRTPLPAPRTAARGVRLADQHRVLLTGGRDASGAFAPDDLVYDVRTGLSVSVEGGASLRTDHTATRLPDGRVLVVGGTTPGGVTRSSSIIDPRSVTPTALPGPPLTIARRRHGAALVGDRLVVFGGEDASGAPLASIEVIAADLSGGFAPLTDSLGNAVELAEARFDMAWAVLGEREVVVAGGMGASGPLASLERIVPDVGALVPVSTPLLSARAGLRAARLGSGAVLFAGGGAQHLEILSPKAPLVASAGSVVPEPFAPAPRVEHALDRLESGAVLITGGSDGAVVGGKLRLLGSAQRYVPDAAPADRFVPCAGGLQVPRRRHTLTALADGGALVAGGLDADGQPLASLERYRPQSDDFVLEAVALPVAVSDHRALRLLDGRVLLCGGRESGGQSSAGSWIFDPVAASVSATANMHAPRERHALVLLADGRVLAAGGWDAAAAQARDDAEVWDPQTGQWNTVNGSLGARRFDMAAVRLSDGRVLLAGGRADPAGAPLDTVAVFDPAAQSLSVMANGLDRGRARALAFADGAGGALIAGGETSAPAIAWGVSCERTASVIRYDPHGDGAFSTPLDPDLPAPVSGARAVRLADGRWWQLGGWSDAGVVRAAAEAIVP